MQAFVDVAAAFSLTVNTIKTVFIAVGCCIDNADRLSLQVRGNTIAHVDQFRYLGSMITPDGRCRADVSARLAAASWTFGSLHDAVFRNADLSPVTKHRVYICCVLSVWLSGAERWTLLREDVRRLEAFHKRCVRVILGVPRTQQ